MKTKSTLLNRIVLCTLLFLPLTGLAQFSPGLPAAFGIDGDVLSGESQNISGNASQGSFDWFRKNTNNANTGYGVIDTSGTSMYKAQILAGQNVSISRGMAYPRYTAVNGYLLLDARYGRDEFGYSSASGQKDFTTYTGGSKNGDNPTTWVTTPNGATVADKADIIDTYIHMRRNGTTINNTNPSALILAMGINTVGNTGIRYVDFELFRQRTEYNTTTGIFSNTGPAATGGHSAWEFNNNGTVKEMGDMAVAFSFSTAGVTDISVYIWVAQSTYNTFNPSNFNFVSGEFYGNSFGYAKIVKNTATPFNAWASVTSATTTATPWGTNSKSLGAAGTGYASLSYGQFDFAEVALDMTSLGIDPALSVGMNPCSPPFTRVMTKSRSSASFTSALQDFTGPYEFLDAPTGPSGINPPGTLKCNHTSITLTATNIIAGAVYNWTTSNGNITSNPALPTITVNKAGKYYLTAALVAGCNTNTDSTTVTSDYIKPVATAQTQGQLDLTNPTSYVTLQGNATMAGSSSGFTWKWGGPVAVGNPTNRVTSATALGTYFIEVTETRNGCKDTAYTPVTASRILPIVLGDFNASYNNGFTQVKWFTSAEYNTSFFEIERSTDGSNFSSIGKVSAKGNSSTRTDYNFVDITAPKGMNYYRLRSVDLDAAFTYSKVVALNTEAVGISLLLVYPNPFGHKVQVKIESEKNEEIQIRLINVVGAVIRMQTEKITKGTNTLVVNDVQNLIPGMYELQIITKSKTFSSKIIKQK